MAETKAPEPKLIQIMQIPDGMRVDAVFTEDGQEIAYPVLLIGLYDDGTTAFLEPDDTGLLEAPDILDNFIRYEVRRRE